MVGFSIAKLGSAALPQLEYTRDKQGEVVPTTPKIPVLDTFNGTDVPNIFKHGLTRRLITALGRILHRQSAKYGTARTNTGANTNKEEIGKVVVKDKHHLTKEEETERGEKLADTKAVMIVEKASGKNMPKLAPTGVNPIPMLWVTLEEICREAGMVDKKGYVKKKDIERVKAWLDQAGMIDNTLRIAFPDGTPGGRPIYMPLAQIRFGGPKNKEERDKRNLLYLIQLNCLYAVDPGRYAAYPNDYAERLAKVPATCRSEADLLVTYIHVELCYGGEKSFTEWAETMGMGYDLKYHCNRVVDKLPKILDAAQNILGMIKYAEVKYENGFLWGYEIKKSEWQKQQ